MEKIEFKKLGNESLHLWVYDAAAKSDKNRTAMIWIHGGGWYSGDPGYFGDDYDYFIKMGIVCFGIEYRLVSTTENDPMAEKLHGAVNDCIDAVLFIKNNADKFGVDRNKIIIVGESAGGHLALCFATDIVNKINKNAIPQMVIAYNPVIETIAKWSTSTGKIDNIKMDEEYFYSRYKVLKEISPIHNIVKNNIPLLLLTGIDDCVVYPGEVLDFYEKYLLAGNDAIIKLYPNTTHAFALPFYYDRGMESRDKSLKDIEQFMIDYRCMTNI